MARTRTPIERMRRGGKHAALFVLGAAGVFSFARRIRRDSIAVLTYHQVLSTGTQPSRLENVVFADEFERQVDYLVRHYHVATGDEVRAFLVERRPLPPNSVFLTFDDGYRNNYAEALSILRRFGATAAFFLTADFVGRADAYLWFDRLDAILRVVPHHEIAEWSRAHAFSSEFGSGDQLRAWIKNVSKDRREWMLDALENTFGRLVAEQEAGRSCEPMNWDHVREMAAAGMTIGSHTMSHQILSRASLDEVRHELVASRERIEMETGKRCWCFSYPNGERSDFRPSDQAAVKAAGYDCAFTQLPGFVTAAADAYGLPRISIPSSRDLRVFLSRVTGVHDWVNAVASRQPERPSA